MKFQSLSLRAKILTIVFVNVFFFIGCITAYYLTSKTQKKRTQIIVTNSKVMSLFQDADMMHDAVRSDVFKLAFAHANASNEIAKEVVSEYKDHATRFQNNIDKIEELNSDPIIVGLINDVKPALSNYLALSNTLVSDGSKMDSAHITSFNAELPEFNKVFDELAIRNEKLFNQILTVNDKGRDDLFGFMDTTFLWMLGAVVLAILLSISLGVWMANLISDPLNYAINAIVDTANNLAGASLQMSEGASEQASSAEEVSASMEQMSANIDQNSDNSQQTKKIAEKAAGEVKQSNESVNQTVESMKTIAAKVSIIGEISRQTNLLALNAAVEAARAGEHGRGFAVVAAEVRKLAERSQVAAEEIDAISVNSVNIAIKSGKQLQDLVPNIQRTSDLVQEIAFASIEQKTGTEQINNALQQLNKVVQQNASSAEELSANASELNVQIEMLKSIVGASGKITKPQIEKTSKKSKKKSPLSPSQQNTPTSIKQTKSTGITIDLGKTGGADLLDKEYEKF
jgi:methyl-accepting chemotaxis protein